MLDLRGGCGFSFGNGCSDGVSEANIFNLPKNRKLPEPAGTEP
jgi:nitrate reductase beta subunit